MRLQCAIKLPDEARAPLAVGPNKEKERDYRPAQSYERAEHFRVVRQDEKDATAA
jgi:hypothetical protein